MHATLAWQPDQPLNASNLTACAEDIIAVLTGETDKNNLGTMNLPGGTTIASSIPAGWEIWDDDPAVDVTYPDAWILRAPTVDDPAQYKYVKLAFRISSNYFYIRHQVMEDWNNVSHTATNLCTVDEVNYTRFPPQNYSFGSMEIVASARFIFIRANLYSLTASFPAMEISRVHPCLAIGSGRVPVVQLSGNAFGDTATNDRYARIPRVLDDAGTTDLTDIDTLCTNGGGRPSTNISNEFDNINYEIAYDDSNNPSRGIQQILFERREIVGQVFGDSTVAEVYLLQGGDAGNLLDRSLHTLDSNDDVRCLWYDTSNVTTHGNIRIIIKAE